jgi:hypothetical protein
MMVFVLTEARIPEKCRTDVSSDRSVRGGSIGRV